MGEEEAEILINMTLDEALELCEALEEAERFQLATKILHFIVSRYRQNVPTLYRNLDRTRTDLKNAYTRMETARANLQQLVAIGDPQVVRHGIEQSARFLDIRGKEML